MKLMTVRQRAELIGKSERSVWRYIELIEAKGGLVVHRMPGVAKTLVDHDQVSKVALTRRRGNPRHRE